MSAVLKSLRWEPRSLAREDDGALVVLSLFQACFLVGLVYYLAGIADGILFKERLQDAADAAAFGPSVLHARGMNLIAMANLAMASTLAVLLGVKIVQVLLTLATVIACVPNDPPADCDYLGSQQAPYAAYVALIATSLETVNGALSTSATATATRIPYLAAQRGIEGARALGTAFVDDGFAASLSLVPGSAEGSTRIGLPVEDDDYANLCVHASEDLPSIFWMSTESKYPSGRQLRATIETYTGNMGEGMAAGAAGLFCGSSTGVAARVRAIKGKACDGIKGKDSKCRDGFDDVADSIVGGRGSFGMVAKSPTSKRIYGAARLGDDHFATWGFATGQWISEKDKTHRGVALSKADRVAPALSSEIGAKTLREAAGAKSEMYYDPRPGTGRSWAALEPEALWNLRWRARLRRYRQPSGEIGATMRGQGLGYVATAAAGSTSDVGAVTGVLLATPPEQLAAWTDAHVGLVKASRATGGIVH